MTFTNFIKRPVLSTVISILIVILGFIGLVSLPIEQYPNIAPPNIVVMATYAGADAETVKNAVVTPLEESINGVEGMDYITVDNTGRLIKFVNVIGVTSSLMKRCRRRS